MESICQNIIMNKRKIQKALCFLIAFIILFTAMGCGNVSEEETGKRISDKNRMLEETVKENREKEDVNSEDNNKDDSKEENKNEEINNEEDSNAAGTNTTKENTNKTETDGRITMAQLINQADTYIGAVEYEDEADIELPDTILWFNATYAPLTYSNVGDWELVGGGQSKSLTKLLLERDWNIEDRDSALEAVERLKDEGHRGKCREYMEELEEKGFLDLDEEAFLQKFKESGIEENAFRYILAYSLYQEDLDADYIAAWDLCRVNQLYAYFYICGYMTYEEAMDASLENSLVLQKLYPSWERMMDSYMLGYQFWCNDPAITDDSPTMKRYQCYQELRQMENGPYSLDWDMELKKSW